MSKQVAERFAEALHKLEENRDLEAIVNMHADNCEVGNIISPEKFHGRDGARQFWTTYRDTFGEVHSEFRNIFGAEGRAALEWTTAGTSTNGQPFRYDGVSILEIEGEQVTRFRAYFDPSGLGHQVAPGDSAAK